jgi:hypothetical protein
VEGEEQVWGSSVLCVSCWVDPAREIRGPGPREGERSQGVNFLSAVSRVKMSPKARYNLLLIVPLNPAGLGRTAS